MRNKLQVEITSVFWSVANSRSDVGRSSTNGRLLRVRSHCKMQCALSVQMQKADKNKTCINHLLRLMT